MASDRSEGQDKTEEGVIENEHKNSEGTENEQSTREMYLLAHPASGYEISGYGPADKAREVRFQKRYGESPGGVYGTYTWCATLVDIDRQMYKNAKAAGASLRIRLGHRFGAIGTHIGGRYAVPGLALAVFFGLTLGIGPQAYRTPLIESARSLESWLPTTAAIIRSVANTPPSLMYSGLIAPIAYFVQRAGRPHQVGNLIGVKLGRICGSIFNYVLKARTVLSSNLNSTDRGVRASISAKIGPHDQPARTYVKRRLGLVSDTTEERNNRNDN